MMDNVWKICGIKLCILFIWIGYRALSQFIERKKEEEDRAHLTKEIQHKAEIMMKDLHLHQEEKKTQKIFNKSMI